MSIILPSMICWSHAFPLWIEKSNFLDKPTITMPYEKQAAKAPPPVPPKWPRHTIKCKFVFNQEVSSLSTSNMLWKDKVCHQLFAEGALLIKDSQSLDYIEYSAFISALVALTRRLWSSLHIPFCFFLL